MDPELATETRLFIPICKVDEEKRLVYGKMTSEEEDSSREIWDYDGSKPYFEAWSNNAEKTSGGKSLGNLRSMHQPIAAGKLTQFVMDDDTKEVLIAAKVVDDGEWNKVLEGVYTGFSQGGRYVKRWKDKDDPSKTRYISDPVEVSLVDLPCLPTATFEYIKADGAIEIRKFTTRETTGVEPTNEQVAARATEMAKAAGDASKWADHVEAARVDLIAKATGASEDDAAPADVAAATVAAAPAEGSTDAPAAVEDDAAGKAAADDAPEADPEAARKAARESLVQVWSAPDGKTFKKAADAVAHILGETVAPPALSPVEAALKAARGDEDAGEAEVVLVKFEPVAELSVAKATLDVLVEKGLYTAGRALQVLEDVISLHCSAAGVAEPAADGSSVPAMLAGTVRALGAAVLAMAEEEVAEAIAALKENAEVEVFVANSAEAEFGKAAVEKAGARNSKKDSATIQKMHDGAVALGASCGDAEKTEVADDLAKRAESDPVLKAVLEERDSLKGEVEKAVVGITDLGDVVKSLREELTALKNTPTLLPPNGKIVGKGADAGGSDSAVDVTKANEVVTELMKTETGRRQLAEAAIRASQMATLGGQN